MLTRIKKKSLSWRSDKIFSSMTSDRHWGNSAIVCSLEYWAFLPRFSLCKIITPKLNGKIFQRVCSGCNTEKYFFLGQRIVSTTIVLYKDDELVGLIITSSHWIIKSFSQWWGQQAKPTSSANKQSNFVINQRSLYLSCVRLVKVSTSWYIKNYNWWTRWDLLHRRDFLYETRHEQWQTCRHTTVYVKYSGKNSVRYYKPNTGHAPKVFLFRWRG